MIKPENFCYWLQGHVEMNPDQKQPTEDQWKMIKDHLKEVFIKVTPSPAPKNLTPQPLNCINTPIPIYDSEYNDQAHRTASERIFC